MPNSSPIYLEVDDIFAIGAEQTSRRKSAVGRDSLNINFTNRAITAFMESVAKMNEAVLVPSKLRDIEVRDCDVTSLMAPNSDLYSFYQMLNTVKQDLYSNTKYQSAFGIDPRSSTNSGQNSGRVTPTGGMSRRSSSINMYGSSPSTPVLSPTGNGSSRSLMPPNTLSFERKLSFNGDLSSPVSPDQLTSSTHSNGNGSSGNLLSPSSPLPLLLGPRTESLNSLLAGMGVDESEPTSSEERVAQITSCFMHHLSALYTILGHFTRSAVYITRRYQEETEDLF